MAWWMDRGNEGIELRLYEESNGMWELYVTKCLE